MTLQAGVDGCRAGWIAVIRDGEASLSCRVFSRFDELASALVGAVIAVDMPIGLPRRVGAGGRGPESAVRPFLGDRQSSVFSIPSRAAVYCEDYGQACEIALQTSDPPRKVSRQGFHLFAKIREIDRHLAADPRAPVFEVHPEMAFCVLNGGRPMATPKKVKGSVNPAGIAERRELLLAHGMEREFLAAGPPRGAAADDFVDACACNLIAGRIVRGEARPYPAEPLLDERGIRIAIWA